MARRYRRFHFEVPEREVEANEAEEASEIISDEREHACVWYIRSPSSPRVREMFVRERREQEMFEIEPPNSHRLCLSRPPRARTPALREHVGRGPRCAAVRTPGSASCDENVATASCSSSSASRRCRRAHADRAAKLAVLGSWPEDDDARGSTRVQPPCWPRWAASAARCLLMARLRDVRFCRTEKLE